MEIKDLLLLIQPYLDLGTSANKLTLPDCAVRILGSYIDDDKLDGRKNPFTDMKPATINRYLNRQIPVKTARLMLKCSDKKRGLLSALQGINPTSLQGIERELLNLGIEFHHQKLRLVLFNLITESLQQVVDSDLLKLPQRIISVNYRSLPHEDYLLLKECNFKCPLSGDPLLLEDHNHLKWEYSIVHIYPVDSSMCFWIQDITPPKDLESIKNKIALSPEEGKLYNNNLTKSAYIKLLTRKHELSNSEDAIASMQSINLAQEVAEVIENLYSNPDDDSLGELPSEPFRLDQKILESNKFLLKDVSNNVFSFYNYINKLFLNLQKQDDVLFDEIKAQIHQAYLKTKRLHLDQSQTVSLISEWILQQERLNDTYIQACRCVVSFFIQKCEVFDVIS